MIEIPLSRGYVAVLDDEDAALVARHRWFAAVRTNTVYAVANVTTNGKRSSLLLHRLVTSAPAGKDVDHIDGDGLNNRRANLRVCEHAENGRNSEANGRPKSRSLDEQTSATSREKKTPRVHTTVQHASTSARSRRSTSLRKGPASDRAAPCRSRGDGDCPRWRIR
jgi:hypothetical protein